MPASIPLTVQGDHDHPDHRDHHDDHDKQETTKNPLLGAQGPNAFPQVPAGCRTTALMLSPLTFEIHKIHKDTQNIFSLD